jgi:hypothetical protein
MPNKEKEAEQMAIKPDGSVVTPSTDPVEIARLQIEQMLADAKKSANEIVENAMKAAEVAKSQIASAPVEQPNDKPVEMVWTTRFKDNGRYKDDEVVAVNGKLCTIQRGKRVQVPKFVLEVLDNSERQDRDSAAFQEELVTKYENNPQ